MRLPLVTLLVIAFALPSAAQCVIGQTALERAISAQLCRSMEKIGIVRAITTYRASDRTLGISTFFDEGDQLDAISDPTNEAVVAACKGAIEAYEETATENGFEVKRTIYSVFATGETNVRPRIMYQRAAPGQPIKIVSVTDGIVDLPLPGAKRRAPRPRPTPKP